MKMKSLNTKLIVIALGLVLGSGCKKEQMSVPQASEVTPEAQNATGDNYKKGKDKDKDNNGEDNNGGDNNGTHLVAVNLGLTANYAILSQSGITDVSPSSVTGNVGSSPITGAAILLSCAEVNGTIFSVDAAGPLPCRITNASGLTTAVGDMQTAYTDAAGRINPDYLNLGAGNIGGLTLSPGLYKWTSAVIIPSNITLAGGPNDVWIFQIAGTLNLASTVKVFLQGGAQAKNIFWQVSGATTLGTASHFEGTILDQTGINLLTGASINGRLLAQTAVVLQMSTVVKQ
jgi:hypothetical protein